MEQRGIERHEVGADLYPALEIIDARRHENPVAQIVEEGVRVAAVVAGIDADRRRDVIIESRGPRPGALLVRDVAEGAVEHRRAVVIQRIGVVIGVDRAVVLDRARRLVILVAQPGVEAQFGRDLEFVDRIKGIFAAVIGGVDVEERPLGKAVARRDLAVGERQVEQTAVIFGGQQVDVAEVPLIVRREVRIIGANGELVVAAFPFDREVVGEILDLLAHDPRACADHLLRAGDRLPAVDIGQAAHRAAERGGIGVRRRRGAGGDEAGRVGIALQIARAVAQLETLTDLVIEIGAEVNQLCAAAVGKVCARPVGKRAEPRFGTREHAGAGIDIAELAHLVAVADHRDRQQPLAAIIEVAREDEDRTLVEIVADIAGDLAALFGGEARAANTLATRIIAADHEAGIFAERPRQQHVAAQVAIVGDARLHEPLEIAPAFLLDEVDGEAGLAAAEQRAGAAANRLDALDRLVDADQLGVFEERQGRGREEGNALHHQRDKFGVATRRIAAHEDVGAILAARAFGRHAGDDLEQVGGAVRRGAIDRVRIDAGDRERRILAVDPAAGGAGDDDLFIGRSRVVGLRRFLGESRGRQRDQRNRR
eukprot:Opistho-1_new@72112